LAGGGGGGGGCVGGVLDASPGKNPALISVIFEAPSPSESILFNVALNEWLLLAKFDPKLFLAVELG
jgi:hypothetical protein